MLKNHYVLFHIITLESGKQKEKKELQDEK